ncbi:MAG: PPC domain-containing DNA-binding protein [bacterium JZ-2024 1]
MQVIRVVPFSLPRRAEMLEEISRKTEKEKILSAFVSCIGAVNRGTLGFFDLTTRSYLRKEFTSRMELVSCTGNISLREGKPWPHLHCVVSNEEMLTFGGHLLEAEVFLVEGFFFVLDEPIVRVPDPESGLTLWNIS